MARRGNSRGQVASEASISLYRLLYNADKPLTFEEILSKLDGGFKNDAYRAYREDVGAESLDDAGREKAWRWWVDRLMASPSEKRRLIVETTDGSSVRSRSRENKVYSANREDPPTVRVQVLAWDLVPWTPEIGKVTARHVAGLKFLKALPSLRGKRLSTDVAEALDLAEEAIRGLPQEEEAPEKST
jgi:hypothetical protein